MPCRINTTLPSRSFSPDEARQLFKWQQAGLTGSGLVRVSDPADLANAPIGPYETGAVAREVYRFNDALQATAPVFIEWGYAVEAYSYNVLWQRASLRIGNAYDGTNVLQSGAAAPIRAGFMTPITSARATMTPAVLGAHDNGLSYAWTDPSGYNGALTVLRLSDPITRLPVPQVALCISDSRDGSNQSLFDPASGIESRTTTTFTQAVTQGALPNGAGWSLPLTTFDFGGRVYGVLHDGSPVVPLPADLARPDAFYTLNLGTSRRYFLPGNLPSSVLPGVTNVAYRT